MKLAPVAQASRAEKIHTPALISYCAEGFHLSSAASVLSARSGISPDKEDLQRAVGIYRLPA